MAFKLRAQIRGAFPGALGSAMKPDSTTAPKAPPARVPAPPRSLVNHYIRQGLKNGR